MEELKKSRICYNNINKYYKEKNKKQYQKQYNIRKYYGEKHNINLYIKQKQEIYQIDIMERIIENLKKRTRIFLKQYDLKISRNFYEILGCNKEEFKKYLESKFINGMNFDNYGDWELDHIFPLSKIDLSNEQYEKYFHYTNIQPLYKKDNIIKSNKVVVIDENSFFEDSSVQNK